MALNTHHMEMHGNTKTMDTSSNALEGLKNIDQRSFWLFDWRIAITINVDSHYARHLYGAAK